MLNLNNSVSIFYHLIALKTLQFFYEVYVLSLLYFVVNKFCCLPINLLMIKIRIYLKKIK